MSTIRLTALSHGAGCACKLSRDELRGVLESLGPVTHPDVVVGFGTRDDAAVWRDGGDRLRIATTDFFTPVVDDPATWGRIAAVNAVSDVYAMGGEPRVALNLVGWPRDLPFELLREVLAGAAAVADETGHLVLGGHSIDSAEPLFGLAVYGDVAEADLLTNAGGRDGDALVLTKALGTGILMTAAKRAEPDAVVPGFAEAIASMGTLNAEASRAAVANGATAATDVTGFGLLGHLHGLATASGLTAEVAADRVPLLPGVLDAIAAGAVPGGTARNAEQAAAFLADTPGSRTLTVLADAQTSGGLLLACPEAAVDALLARLTAAGLPAARIGGLRSGTPGAVRVTGEVG